MQNQPQQQKQNQVPIQLTETAKNPIYANAMRVVFSKDEFMLEFLKVFQPTITSNARIITSPGHVKRIISALQDSVKNYEEKYGEIQESAAPSKEIGFSEGKQN